jgi:heat shock protein 4
MHGSLNSTVVGVDIGAFTTKMAVVERGSVNLLTNEANERETPTVVGYGEGIRKIGEMGHAKLKSNFKNTIVSPHRYLGLNATSPLTKQELSHSPCPSYFQEGLLKFKVSVHGKPTALSPEQALASFMTQLSSTISLHNFGSKLTVFAVPSFFTEIEKRAFLNAAHICGIRDVGLVSETVALGLDYGGYKKTEMAKGWNVLFVDFGYSKLSVGLVGFSHHKMEVVFEKGDRNLGCRDIDQMICDYISNKFESKKGLRIRDNQRAMLKLVEAVQRQRKILSGISETDVFIESLMEDEDLMEPLSRDIMIEEAQPIFEKINQFLNEAKEEIKKLQKKYNSVELVGGGSRIPKIIEMVQDVFEMVPSRTTNSSETIAKGATLAAVQLSGLFKFMSF